MTRISDRRRRRGGSSSILAPVAERILATAAANLVAMWRLNEATGTVAVDSKSALNGAYTGTYTLDQAGLGDGSKSTLFSGGRISLATPITGIDAAMEDKSRGSILTWSKVANAGVWTDGITRSMIEIGADANNRVLLYKNNSSNIVSAVFSSGGVSKFPGLASFSPITWYSTGITWDIPLDKMRFFVNGLQMGSDYTGLGAWVGNLSASWTAIGEVSSSGGSNNFLGNLAPIALWNRALTVSQMAYVGMLNPT